LVADKASISVDSSGELLHRRGWRQQVARAPIRENLAAAVLRVAGWRPGDALVDPMCGSGTLAIEAAAWAAGRAPGGSRAFAFERWPCHSQKIWKKSKVHRPPSGRQAVVAADRDPGAVRAAKGNVARAGLDGRVSIVHSAFADLDPPPGEPGWIVANPPYGQRLGASAGVVRHILEVHRSRWRGWSLALLVPDALARGTELRRVANFKNGGIPVGVWIRTDVR
jgi:putative N6-adenine-specific DNA methylase